MTPKWTVYINKGDGFVSKSKLLKQNNDKMDITKSAQVFLCLLCKGYKKIYHDPVQL